MNSVMYPNNQNNKGLADFSNKEENQLNQASDILFGELVKDRKLENLDIKRELENADTFECKYGEK